MRRTSGVARAVLVAVCLLDACGGQAASNADHDGSGGSDADASDSSVPSQEGGPAAGDAADGSQDVTSTDGTVDMDGAAPGDGAADARPDVPPEDAAAALALCDAIYGSVIPPFEACCSATDMQSPNYTNAIGALQSFQDWCAGDLGASVSKGRITIDPALTAQCAADERAFFASHPPCWQMIDYDLRDLPYQEYLAGRTSCETAVVGLQGVGAACLGDYECQDGLTCIGWTPNTEHDGTCQVPPTTASSPCGKAQTASNESVDYVFGNHPLCGAGLSCPVLGGGVGGAGTCQPYHTPGQDCSDGVACAIGSSCTANVCHAGGLSGDGGPCAGDEDCQVGLRCPYFSTCSPGLAPGATCFVGFSQCEGFCASTADSGTCVSFCNGP